MPRHMGINRAYVAGDMEKSPAEKQRELDAKMKEFLAKGGKIEILPACMNSEEYNNMKMRPKNKQFRKPAKSKK